MADTSGLFRDRDASNGYIFLSYDSPREQNVVFNIRGNSMFYFNGEPHAGDIYSDGWLFIPVRLKKGVNEIYIRTGSLSTGVSARIIFPVTPVMLKIEDATLPDIVEGEANQSLMGAIVVVNSTSLPLRDHALRAEIAGKEVTTRIPDIPPLSIRKVMFRFDGSGVNRTGQVECLLSLLQKGKRITETALTISSVSAHQPYKCTFLSHIDGSLQYFAVNPRKGGSVPGRSLYLSVHGAGVEAIGQARAYQPKEEGDLVAPTNRRPRGFNWEDWGRMDAMEVLAITLDRLKPAPDRIYLTGHSMGGHGTWYLGATYPGKWASIAPCAGYPSLLGYASADGKIPVPGENINEQNLYRASNGSNVFELARNYGASGVYVYHGDDDRTVSVEYARQMRELLGKFHTDFCYYEYPGGSHWWSNESVDWPPLFNFLENHRLIAGSQRNRIDFTTANPAVSSTYAWVTLLQQQEPLQYSQVKFVRDLQKGILTGETRNITALKLDLQDIPTSQAMIIIDGDSLEVPVTDSSRIVTLIREGKWRLGNPPHPGQRGILRNGTFKEPFNHRMVFVYGTSGNREENAWALTKARFDAETWYYRGNGSVDLVADRDFIPEAWPGRGIILYGNAATNTIWPKLLGNCPIQVTRNSLKMGDQVLQGDHYGAYLMYPMPGNDTLSVAAITGTGLPGMKAAYANQYFTGGSGFPDFILFTTQMVREGVPGILKAGFYNNQWQLEEEAMLPKP
ncbi:MAG: alpha/beta hydrolase-fold protein [Bacteroidota bacterium]|nr:alpha/beta hydrolase-fold protein [Bacteroidota bacterium]HNZ69908.1 alpha/beta hydrolase-fold protein [Prolixibacteraceae bacterium]HOC87468.1 alpha/beta hydrolase-fold protein [Prolixibacteraceae bacterium]HOG96777.1 alpha/beta hydrolase-fold protein [Prolixibacteraceae bacterium]HOS89154.1 alpha/beta hydrolase-fold protein [Prolixibacteraceae bacterium]